ncbi:MAG: hypothetical protein ACRD0P_14130 [Stackebrandtia sp.]
MSIDLSAGAPSAQFDTPGDAVEGTILELEKIQQTDMETGEPQYWNGDENRPKMMVAVKLSAPGHKDADESGEVSVYLAGGRYSAVKKVTRNLDEGGWLRLTFTGLSDQAPKVKGYSRAKLFDAEYTAPKASVNLGRNTGAADAQPPF